MLRKQSVLLSILLSLTFLSPAIASEQGNAKEVASALAAWNAAATRADVDQFMALFDDSDQILLAGSDNGEIYRGKPAIRTWLASLFEHNRFSWDLSRADIDSNGNTAWVFVDGTMTVVDDTGAVVKKAPYRFAGVLVKRGGAWKWRMFDGSVPASE